MLEYILNIIFEKYLRENERKRVIGIYYPSEMGFCLRRTYFLYKKPKPIPLKTLLLFESGRVVHEWLANLFMKYDEIELGKIGDFFMEKIKIDVRSEGKLAFKVDEGVWLIGRFDDLLLVKLGDYQDLFLIEVKSVRDISMIREPKESHRMQINFYMKLLGIEEGYIMYVDRKTYEYKIFKVEFSKELWEKLIERVKKLHECLVNDELPEPEGRKTFWMCKYCDYIDECLKGDEEKWG